MVGMAVKVTCVPVHTAPVGDVTIVTPAVTMGLTIWIIAFEVTGLVIGQAILEVSTQLITFPVVGT